MFRIVLLLNVLLLSTFISCRNPKHDTEPHGKVSDEETSGKVTNASGSKCMIGRKIFEVNATEKMTWLGNYMYCNGKNMELPIFSNAEEYQQLVNTIKQQHKGSIDDIGVWTSGYFDADENRYRWMIRLTPMNYTVWRPGRPGTADNRNNCIELSEFYQYKMNDVSCMAYRYVACQTQEKCESQ